MKIQPHKLPFEHVVVDDLFTEEELNLIWREIDFLDSKLLPPKDTGSAKDEKENLLKSNKGIFLDDIYTAKGREVSDILKVNRKVFHENITKAATHLSPFYEFIKETNFDSTLINYYENNDYYDPHKDNALFTIVIFLYREPKGFTGGNFLFSDYEHEVKLKANRMVLFPSIIKHTVTPIKTTSKLPGYGRYSMSMFVSKTF